MTLGDEEAQRLGRQGAGVEGHESCLPVPDGPPEAGAGEFHWTNAATTCEGPLTRGPLPGTMTAPVAQRGVRLRAEMGAAVAAVQAPVTRSAAARSDTARAAGVHADGEEVVDPLRQGPRSSP